MAVDAESIALELAGDFANQARVDALAADALAATLEKLGAATTDVDLSKLAKASQATALKQIQTEANAVAKALQDQAKAATKAAADTEKALQEEAKAAAKTAKAMQDAANAEKKALQDEADAAARAQEDQNKTSNQVLQQGFQGNLSGALSSAGPEAAVAAAAIAAIAAAISAVVSKLRDFTEFGVKMTAEAEKQKAIFDQISHGRGEILYKVSLEVAGETGMQPGEAADKLRELIAARFSESQAEIIVKMSADLDAVQAGKGQAVVDTLKKLKEMGHASEREMKALASAGVNVQDVLKALEKPGETIAQVEARLKKGAVAADELVDAVTKVVESDPKLAGLAGKGLDAQFNKLKILIGELFTGFDLTPLKDALKTLNDLLGGEEGAKLKKSFGDLGSSLIKTLFGPFQGEEGRQRLKKLIDGVSDAASTMAKGLTQVAPLLKLVVDLVVMLADGYSLIVGDMKNIGSAFDSGPLLVFVDALRTLGDIMTGDFDGAAKMIQKTISDIGGIDTSGAKALGENIAEGMADGIAAGASKAIQAAVSMATNALKAAQDALDVHSPSRKFAYLGHMNAEGMAKAMNDNDAPADAAAGMANRALGAAAGPSSAARLGASGGASGGGGSKQVNITLSTTNHLPPGSSEETQKAAKAGSDQSNAAFMVQLRQALRDAEEAA